MKLAWNLRKVFLGRNFKSGHDLVKHGRFSREVLLVGGFNCSESKTCVPLRNMPVSL